jgi:hypothetical protein
MFASSSTTRILATIPSGCLPESCLTLTHALHLPLRSGSHSATDPQTLIGRCSYFVDIDIGDERVLGGVWLRNGRLSEAARTLFHASTGSYTDHEPTLNRIAGIIARNAKVFTRSDLTSPYELVMADEIEEGSFHLGGAYL